MSNYRTAPAATPDMPGGIPYIIGNEAAERFSFYGMRAILVVFMTKYLVDSTGELDVMSEDEAKAWFHTFVTAVYFTPLLGALLADSVLGKYRTILALSLVYCGGHLALALDDTKMGLLIGLGLIALGAGGIKSCVSAHVGDQFGKTNAHLLPRVFGWFYFSINLGAFTSMLLTPVLLERAGPHVAFGIPGAFMALATLVFWMGRHKFIHIPPGGKEFVRETFSPEGLAAAGKLCIIYLFVAMFWALFDQTASAWVLQAEHMNRDLFGWQILSSQLQAVNPIFVLILIPIFSYIVYPTVSKYVFELTPLRKMSIGFFITVLAFAVPAMVQMRIDAGGEPHIIWQILAYFLMTAAEVMVSITCLEFSYTQAPKRMKSFIMGLFMASVALGNSLTAAVNFAISLGGLELEGAAYYWFFTGLMLVTAILFIVVAMFYQERTYIHDEAPIETIEDMEEASTEIH